MIGLEFGTDKSNSLSGVLAVAVTSVVRSSSTYRTSPRNSVRCNLGFVQKVP